MRKISFALLAIFLAATTTVVAQDLGDMPSNSVSECVHSSLFVLDDGTILSIDHNVEGLQLLGVSDPVFGRVEFNEIGELIYSRALGNEDLADEFYLLTDNPRSGMNMLVGEYNPTSNSLRFSPAVPTNEIILVINNGGPELRTFSLDGQNPSDVLEIIRQILQGSYNPDTDQWDRPQVLGGVVRLDGVTTFFGDPRVVFAVVTPEVAEELRKKNAKGSNDLGFLFSGGAENLSQEERKLIFDLAVTAVDIGGILDPTPACDGVACAAELSQGNFIYAGINVVAMVPWLGDLAKAGKANKFIRIVTEAITYAAKNPKFAARIKPLLEVLSNALGQLPESVGRIFGGLKTKIDDFLETLAKKWTPPSVGKAVNSDIVHASERAVERGVFPDIKSAADALRELGKKFKTEGLPPGTIPDPKRPDSVLVPFGNGHAVYEITKKRTAILRTVLGKGS